MDRIAFFSSDSLTFFLKFSSSFIYFIIKYRPFPVPGSYSCVPRLLTQLSSSLSISFLIHLLLKKREREPVWVLELKASEILAQGEIVTAFYYFCFLYSVFLFLVVGTLYQTKVRLIDLQQSLSYSRYFLSHVFFKSKQKAVN